MREATSGQGWYQAIQMATVDVGFGHMGTERKHVETCSSLTAKHPAAFQAPPRWKELTTPRDEDGGIQVDHLSEKHYVIYRRWHLSTAKA